MNDLFKYLLIPILMGVSCQHKRKFVSHRYELSHCPKKETSIPKEMASSTALASEYNVDYCGDIIPYQVSEDFSSRSLLYPKIIRENSKCFLEVAYGTNYDTTIFNRKDQSSKVEEAKNYERSEKAVKVFIKLISDSNALSVSYQKDAVVETGQKNDQGIWFWCKQNRKKQ